MHRGVLGAVDGLPYLLALLLDGEVSRRHQATVTRVPQQYARLTQRGSGQSTTKAFYADVIIVESWVCVGGSASPCLIYYIRVVAKKKT